MASNRFLDRTNKTGDLTDTWHWTNASTDVHAVAAGGNATTCCAGGTTLVAGDYICPQTDTEWYRIASVTDANTIVLAYAYRGTTRDGDTTNFADVSVNDGTTAAKAFVHLYQYISTEVRSVGDVLYCRRGQTHVHRAINMTTDEDGTAAAFIKVIADDGTYWAGEGALADPIFDGVSDTTYTWVFDNRFWRWEELKFTRINQANGLAASGSYSMYVNCTIDDCDGTRAFYYDQHSIYLSGCIISNCSGRGITFSNSGLGSIVLDCVFSSNGVAVYFEGATRDHFIKDCVFTGNTTDISLALNTVANRIQGCTLDFTKVTAPAGGVTPRSFPVATFQDCGSNAKNQNATYWCMGTITRETATFIRAGGADTSIKAIPNSGADDDPNTPLVIYEAWIYSDGTSKTYTVYILADGGWAALPTSAQLWLEANYFDQAGDAGRANIKSNDTIAAEEAWTVFDVTCDPAAVGMVQLRVCLNKYEASKEIWVDPLIVVT